MKRDDKQKLNTNRNPRPENSTTVSDVKACRRLGVMCTQGAEAGGSQVQDQLGTQTGILCLFVCSFNSVKS